LLCRSVNLVMVACVQNAWARSSQPASRARLAWRGTLRSCNARTARPGSSALRSVWVAVNAAALVISARYLVLAQMPHACRAAQGALHPPPALRIARSAQLAGLAPQLAAPRAWHALRDSLHPPGAQAAPSALQAGWRPHLLPLCAPPALRVVLRHSREKPHVSIVLEGLRVPLQLACASLAPKVPIAWLALR